MGIPRFYRYISERYPLINQPISDVSLLPTFDCFYLDMNGIIHNCTHSDDSSSHSMSLSNQLHHIFTYMDRLITHIIKPTQILYIAIDGVAPRAKLNQQRSRRFRAGLDRIRALEQAQHRRILLDEEEDKEKNGIKTEQVFDSNSITPGTAFLTQLSHHLIWFIRYKLKHDPLWQRLEIYFSGCEVPGEGEHKIVDFIRYRKGLHGYHPNTRHCMYGSDADLMLLGLMTHEPHFTLVREVVQWDPKAVKKIQEEQWQLVHLSVLRDYLHLEMNLSLITTISLDKERMLNDFIFLTFLLGNDFIPHSPTLEINENAIPLLIKVYCELLLQQQGQYLTLDGKIVNIHLLQSLFIYIGKMEEEILVTRAEEEKHRNRKQKKLDVALEIEMDGKLEIDELLAREADEHEILSGSESFQSTKWNYYKRKFNISTMTELNLIKKHYMEALVWVLEYYFQGPPCWGWYYPYHYSPMLSDLTEIIPIFNSISFQQNSQGPLLPFEQLMSNLPSSSAHLVPESYRFLMKSPLSPIIQYYPMDFAIDMEGKRNAWEGINLLPFIDVTLLQQCIQQYCPLKTLTKEEQERNQLQLFIWKIVYDPQKFESVPSTHSSLPSISNCCSSISKFSYEKKKPFVSSPLLDGVILPMPGFPTLTTLEIQKIRMEKVQLNCFGMPSRQSTMILQFPSDTSSNEQDTAQSLLNRIVFVNWPHLHQAKVVGMSTVNGEYRYDITHQSKAGSIFYKYDATQQMEWKQFTNTECRRYFSGRGIPGSGGIDVQSISIVIHVVPLQGMIRNPINGCLEKKFGTIEARVPLQLVVLNASLLQQDERFEEKEKVQLKERYPIDSTVLITAGSYLGCTGIVQEIIEEKQLVEVNVFTIEQEPPFGYTIANQLVDAYYSVSIVSKRLGVSMNVLHLLCGNIILKPNDIDIGLKLRYKKELYLPGYVRLITKNKIENVWKQEDIVKIIGSDSTDPTLQVGGASYWECTERTIALLAAYQQQFPDIVRRFEGHVEYVKGGYLASQVFGTKDADEIEQKSMAIVAWIEAQAIGKSEHARLIPTTSTHVSLGATRALEAAGSFRAKEYSTKAVTKLITVPPYELYRPNPLVNQDLTGMDMVQRTSLNTTCPILGDRVINISARGVPFGSRGTIIGTHINSKCVEILFDQEFTGGEALYGTKSLTRGKVVPWKDVLCVSIPENGRQPMNKQRDRNMPGKVKRANKIAPPPTNGGVSTEGFVVSGNRRQHPHQQPTKPLPGPLPVPKPQSTTKPQPTSTLNHNVPEPPDPVKMKQLLKKWSHSAEVEKEDESSVSPSVAAFFSSSKEANAPSTFVAPSYTPPNNPLDGLFPHLSNLLIQASGPPPLPPPPLMVPFSQTPPLPPPPPTVVAPQLNPHAHAYTPSPIDFPRLGKDVNGTIKKQKQVKITSKYVPKTEANQKILLMPSQIKRNMKSTSQ